MDWDDLAREAAFVDRAGAHGIVWPQGSSSVATLTKAERLRGMEVLAQTQKGRVLRARPRRSGEDVAEMLEFTAHAEALAPTP